MKLSLSGLSNLIAVGLLALGCSAADNDDAPDKASAPEGNPSPPASTGGNEGADEPTPIVETPGERAVIDVPQPPAICPNDECPYPGGITWNCQQRFVYGTNFGWERFAGDFGGLEVWGVKSVSQDVAHYSAIFADMKAHGISVLRWWLFPDFRGDGVTWSQGEPTGITPLVLEDIAVALDLAAEHGIYLMLVPFSFDGFIPPEGDVHWREYLTPVVLDPALRKSMVENVIRPIARAVESHPHRLHVHSWDLMNEPEWAVTGPSLYGDEPFDHDSRTDPVSHEEMELFLAEMNVVLRQESGALITVGGSLKWAQAWTGLDTDFHQLHYYSWMEEYHPLDRTPDELGLADKPVILGEFPGNESQLSGSPYSYPEYLQLLRDNGWAGALGWAWGSKSERTALSESAKDAILSQSVNHMCETTY